MRSARRLLLEGLENRHLLAAITVDTLADVVSPADGLTSFREAVIQSNTNGESDTITLPSGTLMLTLTGSGENDAASGDLDITEGNSVTIMGQGSAATVIDASGLSDRAFDILSGAVTLSGLTISGGVASDAGGGSPSSAGDGGAIYNAGALTIDSVILDQNTAAGASGSGGAVLNAGTFVAMDSTISGNVANRAGGGIEDASNQSVVLSNVDLTGNNAGVTPATAAPGNGGGLHVSGNASVTITGGSVTGNVAAREGGGLWNGSGLMSVDGTMIAANLASGDAVDDGGGGIFNNGGDLQLTGVTLDSNEADGASGSGGGLFSLGGDVVISQSTFRFNSANRAGGGIEVVEGAITLQDNSNLINNDVNGFGLFATAPAPGNGGALHVTGAANVTMVGGSVFGNEARSEGGGLWNGSGRMTLDGTLVQANFTESAGAATDAQGGGGIFNNGGTLVITNAAISDNEALDADAGASNDDGGGGIFNNGGFVTLTDTTITGNFATDGLGNGGGLLSLGGRVSVIGGEIAFNEAARAGGGIEINNGLLTMTDVTVGGPDAIDGNVAGINGGGLHVTGSGTVKVSGGMFSQNVAGAEGGGLWNGTGRMTLAGVTIVGNTAAGDLAPGAEGQGQGGGGVFNQGGRVTLLGGEVSGNAATGASGSGGGLFNNLGGSLRVTDTVISGNVANRAGGGIEDASGAGFGIYLTNVTLDGNSAGVDIGGGATAAPGNGGGLHVTGAGNSLITGGVVTGNLAAAEGGGLWNGSGMMIINAADINSNVASGNGADQGGGGIFNAGGRLTIADSVLADNIADGVSGSGGGLFNDFGGVVKASNVQFNSNDANRAGGGIEDNSGAGSIVKLVDVTLDQNVAGVTTGPGAPGNGGGLHVSGDGQVTITRGIVTNNTAASEGGGLWNGSGPMLVTGTVITGNVASGDDASEGGGGLFNAGGELTLAAGVMVANNDADGISGSGGGIFNDGGQLYVYGSTIDNNRANRAGGGIEMRSDEDALLTISDASLTNNVAGVVAAPGNGGAVHVSGGSTTAIVNSTITGNTAAREGGGLWNDSGQMTIRRSEISGNTASGPGADDGGGGVFNNGGRVTVFGGMISNNIADGTAGSGGGVFNATGGTFVANGVEIMSNRANRAGGGIEDASGAGLGIELNTTTLAGNDAGSGMATASPGNGGGLHVSGPGDVRIVASVVIDNQAAREGGGLWNGTGSMVVQSSTISGNVAMGTGMNQGGGGIFNSGGALAVSASQVTQNSDVGGLGDGILSVDGTLAVSSSDLGGQNVGIGIVGSESTIRRNTFAETTDDVVVYGTTSPDTFDVAGNTLAIAGISVRFSEVNRIVLEGREGGDTFNVQPNADTVFSVIGGDDVESTDVLNVLAAGAGGATQTDNGDGSGLFSFDDRESIEYLEIESTMLTS